MKLLEFVQSLKSVMRMHIRCDFTIVFVAGNSSADLDSITSSISYSYLQYMNSDKYVFPLINIPREDIKLRRDVDWLFNDIGIDTNDLLFVEDLKELPVSAKFILVDHNSPQGYVKEYISKDQSKVLAVVDHHIDEGLYLNANPRIIESCGSCSSLVNIYFKDTIKKLKFDTNERKMFISGVCTDTSGLNFRVEPKDIESVSLFSVDSVELVSLSTGLRNAKDDIKGLSVLDLLRKDYKEFETKEGKLGISSTTANFQYFKEEFKDDDFLNSVESWIKERGIFKLVVMTSNNDKDGNFTREIGFSQLDSLVGFDELELTPIEEINGFKIFKQNNIKASRKQVAPILVNLYNQ